MQDKPVFVKGDQSLLLHFGQRVGQGAALDSEIVCKLLAVKGNGAPEKTGGVCVGSVTVL